MHDPELLKIYVAESAEHVEHLEPDLLKLEGNPGDAALVNGLFRAVHSLKGSAGFFGFQQTQKLSHTMENVMGLIRDGALAPRHEVIDALLAGADKLREMVHAADFGESARIDAEMAGLEAVLQGQGAAVAPPVKSGGVREATRQDLALFPSPDAAIRKALDQGQYVYCIYLTESAMKGRDRDAVFADIATIGTVIGEAPDVSRAQGALDAGAGTVKLAFLFATVLEPDLFVTALGLSPEQVREATAQNLDEAAPAAPSAAAMPARIEESIRVPVDVLDDLMNLAEELVLGRNRLARLAQLSSDADPALRSVVQTFNRLSADLQDRVIRTRLQPLESLFNKLPRVVRSLAGELGKEIEVKTTGADVELDKSILERLSDPLVHLVRNSADHGIERPREREADGKPRTGTIQLSARQVPGSVVIEIRDDGRGMDLDMIRRKAVEKGLATEGEVAAWSDRQTLHTILLPGFSTAREVSNVSGRGVGMDVVKTNIDALGGSIELASESGKGATVILRLPLTLAIVPAFIVGASDRRFAIPRACVQEVLRPGPNAAIERVRDTWVLRLRERLLPLVNLADLMGRPPPPESSRRILALRTDAGRFALGVEEILDTEEIVVKPLSPHVKAARCYSGATILGDGAVVLILDAAGIARRAGIDFETRLDTPKPVRPPARPQRLLVFTHAPRERLAIELANVARIEKIEPARIDRIGEREFVSIRDVPLRVIRLHRHLPLADPGPDPDTLYIIVPRAVRVPVGILAARILDTIETPVELGEDRFNSPGILGPATIAGAMTVILDVHGLIDLLEPPLDRPALTGARILLLEGSPFHRAVLSRYLAQWGCASEAVSTPAEAWSRLAIGGFDALLLDADMPGGEGIDLAARCRAADATRHLPIVALNAEARSHTLEAARDGRVDACQIKMDREGLRDALEALLGGHGLAAPDDILVELDR